MGHADRRQELRARETYKNVQTYWGERNLVTVLYCSQQRLWISNGNYLVLAEHGWHG